MFLFFTDFSLLHIQYDYTDSCTCLTFQIFREHYKYTILFHDTITQVAANWINKDKHYIL